MLMATSATLADCLTLGRNWTRCLIYRPLQDIAKLSKKLPLSGGQGGMAQGHCFGSFRMKSCDERIEKHFWMALNYRPYKAGQYLKLAEH